MLGNLSRHVLYDVWIVEQIHDSEDRKCVVVW